MPENRKYTNHGSRRHKRKDYTLAADACCITLDLPFTAADLHYVTTASTGCGAASITLDIAVPSGVSGEIWIVYDSNQACDNTSVAVQVNGVALADSAITITASDERLYTVRVVDTDPLLAAIGAADNLD